eukprot:gb/GECG01016532.1/.p1 GENE.gb/GECG01016532.1/~~gb/GECG01016532.1/.p1  ORF type:complete len:104 (+),score=8.86 gb/GECG01016532.1/:1-312(+)
MRLWNLYTSETVDLVSSSGQTHLPSYLFFRLFFLFLPPRDLLDFLVFAADPLDLSSVPLGTASFPWVSFVGLDSVATTGSVAQSLAEDSVSETSAKCTRSSVF